MQANKYNDESKIDKLGFLKLMRSPESQELQNDPLAFTLLTVIAQRARWRTAFDVRGLNFGEALIGDYKEMGLSRQQYRTRLDRLVKCGFVTIRATPKGTIAKLTSTAVFDINLPPPNERLTNKNQPSEQPSNSRVKSALCQPSTQPTNNQQLTNSQPLTKKERRKQGKNNTAVAVRKGSSTLTLDRKLHRIEAATATDKEFVKKLLKLKKHFPGINIRNQIDRYHDFCEEHNRQKTRKGCIDWLKRARPELKRVEDDEEDYDSDDTWDSDQNAEPSPPEKREPFYDETCDAHVAAWDAKNQATHAPVKSP